MRGTDLTFQTERQATYEVRDNAYKLMNERPEGFPSLLESLIKAGEERSMLEETPIIDMRPHYNYEVSIAGSCRRSWPPMSKEDSTAVQP
jgi:hypothetical protein